MNGDIEDFFGITETELDAIMDRAKTGQLTDDDQVKAAAIADVLSEALPQALDMLSDAIFFPLAELIGDAPQITSLCNQFLAESGFTARLELRPTYRTEPIPGAELGGTPRNPEADVIDEIDRLVDWQMGEGGA